MRPIKIAAAVAFVCAALGAGALPTIRTDFLKAAKIKKGGAIENAQCSACHISGTTKLNAFGLDLQKLAKAAKSRRLAPDLIKKLGALDSDKDKVTNSKEWKADTLPGDPKSKPKK